MPLAAVLEKCGQFILAAGGTLLLPLTISPLFFSVLVLVSLSPTLVLPLLKAVLTS